MIGDLLNEQSFMHLALTEMIYLESDVNDNTTYVGSLSNQLTLSLACYELTAC